MTLFRRKHTITLTRSEIPAGLLAVLDKEADSSDIPLDDRKLTVEFSVRETDPEKAKALLLKELTR